MASQGDASVAAATETTTNYPNYDNDIATFEAFVLEHTILRVIAQDEEEEAEADPNRLLEPTDGPHSIERVPCYPPLLQRIVNRDFPDKTSTTFLIEVPLAELQDWDSIRGADLAQRATDNTLRYQALFSQVLDQIIDRMEPNQDIMLHTNNSNNNNHATLLRDTVDILLEDRLAAQQRAAQRQQQQQQNQNDLEGPGGLAAEQLQQQQQQQQPNPLQATQDFPSLLLRRYELRILPVGRRGTLEPFRNQHLPKAITTKVGVPVPVSLRHVRSKSMGRLVTITGMIVRASDVKPYCQIATYTCDDCGAEVYQPLDGKREFMPPRQCPACPRGTLQLQTRGSKFTKFQEVKLQELPSQVPMGHIPRSLQVYCRGELTRRVTPGDVVTVDGIFLPQRVPGIGLRAARAGLMARLYLEAQHLHVHKQQHQEQDQQGGMEEDGTANLVHSVERDALQRAMNQVAQSEDPIGILSASIAPEIFGHEDIKRALLLQLTSGVSRKLQDGMKIRGDINLLLMGDPGVAKSQLLKHVASIAPRGVYTTGKGSSGVGLTAAVTKDTVTGELSLEGGALVLADRGICAIDEFDKMDEADRTAIHEVMEQQTVSIAKAGIVATLNARAAVLAAANPLYSRYNRRKSLSENINLPNSLLSRFDLMFLILDTPDVDRDMALARHVTFVHQHEGLEEKAKDDDDSDCEGNDDGGEDKESEEDQHFNPEKRTVSSRLLREYIARARQHQPMVPPEVAPYVVEAYVSMRMQDRPGRGSRGGVKSPSNDQTVMTARQLLSILRLSQALARLRFSDYVAREDVDEAIRLTHMSRASLTDEIDDGNSNRKRGDVMSRVFSIVRDYSTTSQASTLEMKLCEAMVIRKGFTTQHLKSCLEEYEALEIIQVNQERTQIHFLT